MNSVDFQEVVSDFINNPIESHKAQDVQKSAKEKARIQRHIAKPAVYQPRFFPLTAQQRSYMKRFGSKPKKSKQVELLTD